MAQAIANPEDLRRFSAESNSPARQKKLRSSARVFIWPKQRPNCARHRSGRAWLERQAEEYHRQAQRLKA